MQKTNAAPQQDIFVASPTVAPYDQALLRNCAACGARITSWDRFAAYLKSQTPSVRQIRYCDGGKAPTEDEGMFAAMMTGKLETFNPCAGVTEPHLHLKCSRCGHMLLMRTQHVIARS